MPLYCLHTHHPKSYWDLARDVGTIFLMIYGIGKYEACLFFDFLRAARHPADSDGRPAAGAQVLAKGTIDTMTSVPLWASTALQSAVSLWEL